jgi:hypothetical protein
MKNNNEAIVIYKNLLDGKITSFPMRFWIGVDGINNAKIITKYFIDNILTVNVSDKNDILNKISIENFRKYKLGSMLQLIYTNSPFKAFSDVYPNIVFQTDIITKVEKSRKVKFENIIQGRKEIKKLIEEILQWDLGEVDNKLTYGIIQKNGLKQILRKFYNESPYLAVKDIYPDYEWKKIKARSKKFD